MLYVARPVRPRPGEDERIAALRDLPTPLAPIEVHASVGVPDLALAARFYTRLLGVEPTTWTHRYVTFMSERLRTNFVLLVSDGLELHEDKLYHLGVDVGSGRGGRRAPSRHGCGLRGPQAGPRADGTLRVRREGRRPDRSSRG